MIKTLISAPDNVELITDQIGMLLVNELRNQRDLAISAGRSDLTEWEANIYTERSNIFEQALNREETTPVINVWFDTASYDKSTSNISERQTAEANYNIDVYGFGISRDNSTGFNSGDESAAREAMRAARLIRQVLMAADNTYLQMSGTVWQRWVTSLIKFQPQLDDRAAQQVHGARLILAVKLNEFSPQAEPVRLESVALDVFRRSDGSLIAEADWSF